MFPSINIDENPTCIPFITENLNKYCNSQITLMLNKIANDYSLDITELTKLHEPINLKLSNHVHYPPENKNRCKARIWNNGRGGQCRRKSCKNGFCNIHAKQHTVCVENKCKRGEMGLGACNNNCKKGLWLGTINKPLPRCNDKGDVVIKWYGDKSKTIKKKKKKKKFKTIMIDSIDKNKFTKDYESIHDELIKLLNTLDLDDTSLNNNVIMKRLGVILKYDVSKFKKQIYDTINKFWDELVAKEFSDSDETDNSSFDVASDLTQYFQGDKTYYVHTHTNEIYDNPKTLNVIGIMLSDNKFELF